MKIILCGYMGVGKSTLGKQVAQQLGISFYDLDEVIQEKEGKTIAAIFSRHGEIYFRKTENQCLASVLSQKNDYVLALGGGTPCYGNNLQKIKSAKNTRLVYLRAGIAELTKRLFGERQKRPLLSHISTTDELEEYIGKHLFERQFYYLQSDQIIDVEGKTLSEQVALMLQ